MSFYKEKLDSILKREISEAVLKEVDRRDFLITITKIKTSPDCLESEIYFKVFPESKEKEGLLELEEKKKNIQRLVNKRIKMKHVPKIIFRVDKD